MVNHDKIVTAYNKTEKKLGYNDCGVQIFRKDILRLIPKNKKVSLENEIFPLLIKKKKLIAFETKADFFDFGSFEGLDKFKIAADKYFNRII